jgi:hypothetical protein
MSERMPSERKIIGKSIERNVEPDEPPPELLGRRKRPEHGQFRLQVDRQTKSSYTTLEAAEQAGMVIKRGHPILQVAVYDAVSGVNKILELSND